MPCQGFEIVLSQLAHYPEKEKDFSTKPNIQAKLALKKESIVEIST
jgi:hypothetical protein